MATEVTCPESTNVCMIHTLLLVNEKFHRHVAADCKQANFSNTPCLQVGTKNYKQAKLSNTPCSQAKSSNTPCSQVGIMNY